MTSRYSETPESSRPTTRRHAPQDSKSFIPLNAEFNPICHLLALLGAHHILHVSGARVNYEYNQRDANDIGQFIGPIQLYIR